MSSTAELFRQAELLTDETIYTLIRLPSNAVIAAAGVVAESREPFSALIVDESEVSLVLSHDAWEAFSQRLPDAHIEDQFRLITFNITLSLDIIGFMAMVANILATADVPIMPYAAFSRDHILVPESHFQKAWNALKNAQQSST